ncbi:restriction endonuclease subunit S [Frederiksenia canicola]|uniref:Type I restriction enzyme S subunit n=1 Tax=Frederiksenia canicola TaxID=123824 RepID=A0AAE6X511_9PAST|nr:restriction endonuclease subunit S [Frederiksenia canicola]QIM64317.1 hypothetical protein A4G17_02025 [Frederiksenia canicola]RPE93863.1 type I restriction enzyme S subunit [Frederiksenia canicola]
MKLGELVNIKTGKLDANAAVENGQYPFFTTAREISRIDKYSFDDEVVLVAGNGDLNVKYYKGKFDAYQRTYVLTCKKDKELNMKYLYYFMEKYLGVLRQQAIGCVIKYIKLENLTEPNIYYPSIETQTQIAQILDKSTALIAKRKAQIAELDKLVQSVFLEMFGDPVINTRNWNLVQLSTLGYLGRGGSKHRPRNDPKLLGGEYPFIQTGDIANSGLYLEEYKNTYSKKGFEQSKMWEKGTLCITIAANIAKTAILKFNSCFPDSVVGFIPNSHTNAIFINYWFSFFQRILEETAPESAQKNINLDILSKLNVICPDIKLQTQFAQIAEKIHAQKSLLQKSLAELEVLHQALMQKAFNGQFVG